MAALFKTPKVQAPPRPPTVDDARANLDIRKQLAARKGRAANIAAGANPLATGALPAVPGTAAARGPASKILLGE